MNISVDRLPECRARLSAEVPSSAVAEVRGSIVREYSHQAKLPGFRVGKIPVSVVEKKFADQILAELKDRLARDVYREARESHSLGVLGIVQVERDQVETDGNYYLAVEVVVEPEVEVGDYKGIPVNVPKLLVADWMVDQQLESARGRLASLGEVDRRIQAGDAVELDHRLKTEDESLREELGEGMKLFVEGAGYRTMIPEEGSEEDRFPPIPGLTDSLVGRQAGETFEFEAVYPEDFEPAPLAGRTLVYEVTVKVVMEMILPELDDELARNFGAEGLEDFRERIRGMIAERQTAARKEMIESQILDHLNREAGFDLPQHLVFQETQNQVNRMVMRGYEQGMSEEDFSQHEEDLIKSAEARAKANVQTSFILEQIADKEGIQTDERELVFAIQQIAEARKRPFKKVLADIKKEDAISRIAHDIKIQKTIAFLREHAEITEVDPPEGEDGAPAPAQLPSEDASLDAAQDESAGTPDSGTPESPPADGDAPASDEPATA